MNELPKTRRANQSGGVCVVVAIDAGDEHLRECLESVRANAGAGVEIVEAQRSAAAVNRAIEQASPADIVVLDEPCLVNAGWIERLADAARADTNTASASALADAGTPLALQTPGRPHGDFAQLAESLAERTLTLRPRLSRAVAPCVYIRRDALQLVSEVSTTGRSLHLDERAGKVERQFQCYGSARQAENRARCSAHPQRR